MLFLNEAEPKALILCGCLVIQLCMTGRLHSVLRYSHQEIIHIQPCSSLAGLEALTISRSVMDISVHSFSCQSYQISLEQAGFFHRFPFRY